MTSAAPPLVLVANARMPSPRAQSLQVAQAAASYARAGAPTTLLHARRSDTVEVTEDELWRSFAVPDGARPSVVSVPCVDAIDRVPRALQYLPARAQELTFARNAARRVEKHHADARVLTRELEVADRLRRRGGVFLELHRVPGGKLRRRWLLRAADSIDGIVAISGGVRDDLERLGVTSDAILVAHDAYDPARFDDLPDREEACRLLQLDPERPVVAYTGGLLEWKGVEVLVDAAGADGLDGVQFVIAGGMPADIERIRARAAGLAHVRIDGFQPAARVPLYLAAADLGVVPNRSRPAISSRYTSPLKVFEAKAAGLPLVASDLPSLREVLTEDEALFVAPDDAAALAGGIARLLGDGAGRRERAAAMRGNAAGHTWDARAGRVLEWMGSRS